jgi:TPR repeat protein
MAHLMGQLGLASNPEAAIPLLQHAATIATVDVPQPAYVFGLLLLGEFSQASIPPHLFTPLIPPGGTRDNEARRHLERAAYLNFSPAQYKLGHAYEFAQPPFPFDALLSVQYYSLASQQGEFDADMALSKWFLCGAEGAFDKDESLAYTFAEKAARKGLPSAEFAMGYYTEVGVGGLKDIEAARKWYTRVSNKSDASHFALSDVSFPPLVYRHPNTGTRTLLIDSPPYPSPHPQPSPVRNTTI